MLPNALYIRNAGGLCDPRPILLSAALSGVVKNIVLPEEFDWCKPGFEHCFKFISWEDLPEGARVFTIPANHLMSPETIKLALKGQQFDLAAANARSAFEWYWNTCNVAQMGYAPIIEFTHTPFPVIHIPITCPQEDRGFWLACEGNKLYAHARTAYGCEVIEELGEANIKVSGGPRTIPTTNLSPHDAYLIVSKSIEGAVAAKQKNWKRLGECVDKCWEIERASLLKSKYSLTSVDTEYLAARANGGIGGRLASIGIVCVHA